MVRIPHTSWPYRASNRLTQLVGSVVNTSDANTVHPARSNGVHNRAEYEHNVREEGVHEHITAKR